MAAWYSSPHLEAIAIAKGCRVTVAAAPVAVRGERELHRRAVEHGLRNAVRHAPEGTLAEAELRLDGGTATITARDYGEGVPEESLGEIFKPFFRVEGDRSRASGGVGLGLAIARRAVGLHRGQMTARNASPGLFVAIELPDAWASGVVEAAVRQ
jgi:signal transduction histidine kinase